MTLNPFGEINHPELPLHTFLIGKLVASEALLFLIVSTRQMAIWAAKKHKAYKKEFGASYPKRKAMFPFIF